jgi:hypothetical protein
MGLYVALIYSDEKAWETADESVSNDTMEGHNKFGATHGAAIRAGHGLESASTATTLRKGSSGDIKVSDGPFAETKESLGGFYAIEAPNLDAAIAIAKDIPMPFGCVEVRPVKVYD